MRKISLIISIVLLIAALAGCNSVKNEGEPSDTVTPSPGSVITQPAEDEKDNAQENEAWEAAKLADYFPMLADVEYVYEGTGSEYASYVSYNDFIDEENHRFQTRTNNGGTETVKVIEIKDGKASVTAILQECYYRDNLMEQNSAEVSPEVLLMEPLIQGTEWTLPDGRIRTISATDVTVETPLGSYDAIEVTTQGQDSVVKNYYAPRVGLVKSVFGSGDMEVTSTLAEVNSDTPFTQLMEVFYPDADEKIYVEPLILSFKTNDITREVIAVALRQKGEKESYLPLASTNTKINSMYLGKDNIAYVDFSKELVQEMNAGAGYEMLILQSITNTLGYYYGVEEVAITVDGKPYESGHIQMLEGETLRVNPDAVVR